MQVLKTLAVLGMTWAVAVSPASADVHVSMENGRVSLVAKDATVRQILTEWARVGHTQIVNVERIPGGPMTLELENMPEDQALDLLLRSISGYVAAPRAVMVANASRFDRIVVLPTASAPRAAAAPAPPPQPVFFAPPQPTPDDDTDDEEPAPNVVMPQNPRGPVFNAFPQPQVVNPRSQGGPGVFLPPQQEPDGDPEMPAFPGAPTAPAGATAVPGMVAPVPQQPGQLGPGQVPVTRRPGGRGGRGGWL